MTRERRKASKAHAWPEFKRGFWRAIGTGAALLLLLVALVAFATYTGQDFDFGTIVINGSQIFKGL